MKYQFILFIVFVSLLSACSPKRSNIPANAVPTLNLLEFKTETPNFEFQKMPKATPNLLLSLERYPCFGKCPVFEIEFFDNGFVRYTGKRYMDLIGNYSTNINKRELNDLLTYAVNINYPDLSTTYPRNGKVILDVPFTITYVKYGAEINRIENHHNAPIDLIKFEEHIELLINNLNWEKASL